jgi:heme exporter protein A
LSSPLSSTQPRPSSATDAAVVADGLERHYGDRVALAGISFSLAAGETLAVLGPNGAGKTTLLRVLATLLRPHGGSVSVLGAPLPEESWRVRGRIGYLAHEPLLYRALSGRENLVFNARLHRAGEERVDELIAAVGLARRADDPVEELSRGMLQRLAAARAVLHEPELLLLDEPLSALDPKATELLQPLIGRASGRTRVLVTHDVERGIAEADQVLGLRAGKQAFVARAADVSVADAKALYE